MELAGLNSTAGRKSALLRRRGLNASRNLSCAAAVAEIAEQVELKRELHRRFQIKGSIGHCGFWDMQLAMRSSDEKEVVIKLPFLEGSSHHNGLLQRELDILKRISHPHIEHAIELVCAEGRVGLVTEYISGCYLNDLVVNAPDHRLSEELARSLSIMLFQGVQHLHSKDICHKGIKPEKVRVSDDHTTLRLTDFTTACRFEAAVPGAVRKHAHSESSDWSVKMSAQASDVWNSGACLHFMLSGKRPSASALQHLEFSEDKSCNVSWAAIEVMSCSLTLDSQSRPAASELLQFEWLRTTGIENEDTNTKSTVVVDKLKGG